ncbi:hypothetical protein SAMN06296386_11811 [Lachnospiraceae bacterium]|nr:hypothetical protein SAMN06296386_11811 [Lachnospiraceae bacterium]
MTEKKKMSEGMKNAIYVCVLILLIGITFTIIFSRFDYKETIDVLRKADMKWIAAAVLMNLGFVSFEAWNIGKILKSISAPASFLRCIKYVLIEIYFNAVTPSASGGQPMQIVEMKKDGVPFSASAITLMVIAIAYKGALLILMGIMAVMGKWSLIENFGRLKWLFWLGLFLNSASVLLMFIILVFGGILHQTIVAFYVILAHFHIIRDLDYRKKKLESSMRHYREGSAYILRHAHIFYRVVLFSVFQRICRFGVTWVVFRAFGLEGADFMTIVLLAAAVSVAADMMPIPGAVGINETCYLLAFRNIFGAKFLAPSMLLSRTISFYGMVLFCAVYLVVMQLYRLCSARLDKS